MNTYPTIYINFPPGNEDDLWIALQTNVPYPWSFAPDVPGSDKYPSFRRAATDGKLSWILNMDRKTPTQIAVAFCAPEEVLARVTSPDDRLSILTEFRDLVVEPAAKSVGGTVKMRMRGD